MKIIEHMGECEYGTMRLPKLEGRVRVVLKDKKTGRIEKEVRGHNVITNAVKDIFSHNVLGCLTPSSLMPLYQKWYGGILGYKQAFSDDTNPADYFIKGNDVQELIGFAGDVNPSTAQLAEDKRRGRKIAESLADGIYEQTFEWGSEEGNGVWSAVSLCHKDLGNASTGSTSSTFQAFQPLDSIGSVPNVTISLSAPDNIFTMYDDNHGLWFHIGDEDDYYVNHSSFETKKLTVIIRRLPYAKVGMLDTLIADTSYPRVFTVELTNFNLYNQPSYYFDYENKKLWIFSNLTGVSGYQSFPYSKTTVNYAIIDCENESVDSEGTIVSDDSDLAPTSMEKYPNRSTAYSPSIMRNANIIKEGNYVYLPMSDGADGGNGTYSISKFYVKGLKKINISNQSDQSSISYDTVQTQYKSAFRLGGLIINSGKIVNGDVGYTCASQLSEAEAIPCYALHTPYKASSLVSYLGAGSGSSSQPRYIFANKLVNTTIFNLKNQQQQPTSFTKDNTKLLQITYTLTEVSS